MVIVDDPPLDHSQHALVMVVPPPGDLQREEVLAEVRGFFMMIMVLLLPRVSLSFLCWFNKIQR